MSRLEIRKVNPESPGLVGNLIVMVDGVCIEDVENVEFWVRRGSLARATITFAPTEINICADVLTTLKAFIDKELEGDAKAVRSAEETDTRDADGSDS